MYDVYGKEYLDFAAGIAVNALGEWHGASIHTLAGQLWRGPLNRLFPGTDDYCCGMVFGTCHKVFSSGLALNSANPFCAVLPRPRE